MWVVKHQGCLGILVGGFTGIKLWLVGSYLLLECLQGSKLFLQCALVLDVEVCQGFILALNVCSNLISLLSKLNTQLLVICNGME